MEREVVEVATKAEEAKEVEEVKVDVELPEDTINMEIIIKTSDWVLLYESIYFNTFTRHQRIK